jgi:flavin-dependent dehydrogenase
MINTKILIIGAGPAGAACAGHLQQQGVDCLVLDKHTFPRPKPCAGWTTPEVWQLLQTSPQEYPYGLTHFSSFQVSVKGIRFRLKTNQYAIRRYEFDAWLLEKYQIQPVTHTVRRIERCKDGFIVDDTYSCQYLIGAGGTNCPVRRFIDAEREQLGHKKQILAMEDEFEYPVVDHHCHLWFFENRLPGYSWYVPKANGYVNVGVGGSAARMSDRGDSIKRQWRHLIDSLAASGLVIGHDYQPRGYAYYLREKSPAIRQGNAFLLGDSAGLATNDMGEGIGPAIQSGILAASAIVENKPYTIRSIPRFSLPSLLGLRK